MSFVLNEVHLISLFLCQYSVVYYAGEDFACTKNVKFSLKKEEEEEEEKERKKDHKRNVSDGVVSGIGTLLSLDHKLNASDYDSDSVAAENQP